MGKYFEPKYKGHYKRRCHDLMVEIWGESKEGTAAAYLWLGQNFGHGLHFKTENNEARLKEIYTRLWLLSFNPPENPTLPHSYIKKQRKAEMAKIPLSKRKQKRLSSKRTYGKVVQPKDLLHEVAQRNQKQLSYWKRFTTFLYSLHSHVI